MERTTTEKQVAVGTITKVAQFGNVHEVTVKVGPCETAAFGVSAETGWVPEVGQEVDVWAVRYKHQPKRSSTGESYTGRWVRELRPA